jgi:GTP-binding protein
MSCSSAATSTPVVALVGRPNVGKSTLFNRLTRSRAALVADIPGLTRDRHYGQGRLNDRRFIVIDTGGFEPVARQGIAAEMARQARQAVIESDLVVFVVDGRDGMAARDRDIANELRRTAARVVLVVNKTEGMPRQSAIADFWSLGLGQPYAISAAHGDGVTELFEELLPPPPDEIEVEPEFEDPTVQAAMPDAEAAAPHEGTARPDKAALLGPRRVKVAVVGRPNAGKSTLINTLLGEERMATQEIRAGDARGRHTTSHRHLVLLAGGGLLLDTPGIREVGLIDADAGLDAVFEDIERMARDCRFRNCGHGSEPGCAVREALEAGRLDADRWAHFQKLSREVAAAELAKQGAAQEVGLRRMAAQQRAYRSNKQDLRDPGS